LVGNFARSAVQIWPFGEVLTEHPFFCSVSVSRTRGINVYNLTGDMSPVKFETFFEDKQFLGMPLNVPQEVRCSSPKVSLLATGKRSSVAQEVSLLFSGTCVVLHRKFRWSSKEAP